jgi:hypothetical protein
LQNGASDARGSIIGLTNVEERKPALFAPEAINLRNAQHLQKNLNVETA